ncbi:hypothetical protein C5S53_14095 [Methanophagales archaeon]|nr:hypothetical protein C5S53_14095 [Methanophagales archaeon]
MTESRWSFVAHALRIAIFFFLVISISNDDLQWTLECISGIIICSVPILLKRIWNFKLPVIIDFLIVFALFLHVGLGGVFDVYYAFPNFDIITHFVSAVLIAFLALIALYLLHEHWEGLFMHTYALAFAVVVITMASGVVWELGEWASDALFGLGAQWSLHDTMTDLLVDTIGGIFMALVGIKLIKTGRLEEMTKDMSKHVDILINHKK